MQTRAHQSPLFLLQQKEQHALAYFSRWTLTTPLTPSVIHDLQSMRLLSSLPLHCDCGAELSLHTSARGLDKHEYRCSSHGSRTHRSIRHDSWFEHRTHSIPTHIIIIRMLAHGLSQHSIALETQLSSTTLHTIYRDLCSRMVIALETHVFTADPFFPCHYIVEVDEAHMKWRGAPLTGAWEAVGEHEGGTWVLE
jgi:hypothetical protein